MTLLPSTSKSDVVDGKFCYSRTEAEKISAYLAERNFLLELSKTNTQKFTMLDEDESFWDSLIGKTVIGLGAGAAGFTVGYATGRIR